MSPNEGPPRPSLPITGRRFMFAQASAPPSLPDCEKTGGAAPGNPVAFQAWDRKGKLTLGTPRLRGTGRGIYFFRFFFAVFFFGWILPP